MAENKVTPDVAVPEVAPPAAETTPTPAVETTTPAAPEVATTTEATPAETPAATPAKTKKSPLDIVKKFLAKFKKEKKAEPVAA